MSVTTTQYIRKPLFVAAVRVTGANFDEIAAWCQGEVQQDDLPDGVGKKYIRVRVHNPKNPRQTKAFVGDWLLYTERGYKVYTNKAFHASFDEVNPEAASDRASRGYVMGSEQILPGLTFNDVIDWLRAQSAENTLDQIRMMVQSGEISSNNKEQSIGVNQTA